MHHHMHEGVLGVADLGHSPVLRLELFLGSFQLGGSGLYLAVQFRIEFPQLFVLPQILGNHGLVFLALGNNLALELALPGFEFFNQRFPSSAAILVRAVRANLSL